MTKRSSSDLFVISGKWIGVYLELFLKIQGSSWKFVDCVLILDKNRGLFAKWHQIIGFELFSNEKRRGLGPQLKHHGRHQSTVDHYWSEGGGRGRLQPIEEGAELLRGGVTVRVSPWHGRRRRRLAGVGERGRRGWGGQRGLKGE
jgi:hypothetical protein